MDKASQIAQFGTKEQQQKYKEILENEQKARDQYYNQRNTIGQINDETFFQKLKEELSDYGHEEMEDKNENIFTALKNELQREKEDEKKEEEEEEKQIQIQIRQEDVNLVDDEKRQENNKFLEDEKVNIQLDQNKEEDKDVKKKKLKQYLLFKRFPSYSQFTSFNKIYFNSIPLPYLTMNHPNQLAIILLHIFFIFFAMYTVYYNNDVLKTFKKTYGFTDYKLIGQIHTGSNSNDAVVYDYPDYSYQNSQNSLFIPTRIKLTKGQKQNYCSHYQYPCLKNSDCGKYTDINSTMCRPFAFDYNFLNKTIQNQKQKLKYKKIAQQEKIDLQNLIKDLQNNDVNVTQYFINQTAKLKKHKMCVVQQWCPMPNPLYSNTTSINDISGISNQHLIIYSKFTLNGNFYTNFNGTYFRFLTPNIKDETQINTIKMADVLSQAQISYDDIRYTGCILKILIQWTCDGAKCNLEYIFKRIDNYDDMGYTQTFAVYEPDGETRDLHQQIGIKIFFETIIIHKDFSIGSGLIFFFSQYFYQSFPKYKVLSIIISNMNGIMKKPLFLVNKDDIYYNYYNQIMEFYTQTIRFQNNDKDYLELREKLNKQQDSVQKQFDEYLKIYSQQYADQGYEICKQSQDKQKCIKFYMNNILVYKDNVIGKLNSLVYNYNDL